jgi:hypothetical protein
MLFASQPILLPFSPRVQERQSRIAVLCPPRKPRPHTPSWVCPRHLTVARFSFAQAKTYLAHPAFGN